MVKIYSWKILIKYILKRNSTPNKKDTYYKHKAFILIPTSYILLYGTYNIVLNSDWDISVGGTEGSQISTRETRNVNHAGLFLQKKRWIICLLLIRLWMNVD